MSFKPAAEIFILEGVILNAIVAMPDLHEKLQQMHELLVDQVLDELAEGSHSARITAMALLKNSNIQAVVQNNSAMSKLAAKLDFSAMSDKVVEFKSARSQAS
jgi:hypothetical protein